MLKNPKDNQLSVQMLRRDKAITRSPQGSVAE